MHACIQLISLGSLRHRFTIKCTLIVVIISFTNLLFLPPMIILEFMALVQFLQYVCHCFLWLPVNAICGFSGRGLENLTGYWQKIAYPHLNDSLLPLTLKPVRLWFLTIIKTTTSPNPYTIPPQLCELTRIKNSY
jgi:hypothetical protein